MNNSTGSGDVNALRRQVSALKQEVEEEDASLDGLNIAFREASQKYEKGKIID